MTKIGQREIKFRVWLIKEQRMLEFEPPIVHEEVTTDIIFRGTGGYEDLDIWHIEHVLMQYTGLKDKNGVEIAEGDIIEFEEMEWGGADNKHIVTWDNEDAQWSWGGGSTSDMEYRAVIGNIFEATDEQLKEWNIKREDYI